MLIPELQMLSAPNIQNTPGRLLNGKPTGGLLEVTSSIRRLLDCQSLTRMNVCSKAQTTQHRENEHSACLSQPFADAGSSDPVISFSWARCDLWRSVILATRVEASALVDSAAAFCS